MNDLFYILNQESLTCSSPSTLFAVVLGAVIDAEELNSCETIN